MKPDTIHAACFKVCNSGLQSIDRLNPKGFKDFFNGHPGPGIKFLEGFNQGRTVESLLPARAAFEVLTIKHRVNDMKRVFPSKG